MSYDTNRDNKGIGLALRSRILRTMMVLGCAVPVAAAPAPVIQPLAVYANETVDQEEGEENQNDPEQDPSGKSDPVISTIIHPTRYA